MNEAVAGVEECLASGCARPDPAAVSPSVTSLRAWLLRCRYRLRAAFPSTAPR